MHVFYQKDIWRSFNSSFSVMIRNTK